MVVILRENAHGGAVDPKQPGKSHGAKLVMLLTLVPIYYYWDEMFCPDSSGSYNHPEKTVNQRLARKLVD